MYLAGHFETPVVDSRRLLECTGFWFYYFCSWYLLFTESLDLDPEVWSEANVSFLDHVR